MLKENSVKTSIFCKSALIFLHSFFIVGFLFFFQTDIVCSQSQDGTTDIPVHVISDTMVAQRDTSMVEFIGNVKVTREDSILFADSIKIYFAEDNKDKGNDAQSKVKKIVSTGNVRYTAGERKGFADKAIYTTQDEVLVLTGKSPKLITGTSFVTGKKITLYRNQDKVIVESDGTKRVEAFFNPEDKKTDKQ